MSAPPESREPRPPVVVLWHPRERLSKCTLAPLRGRPDIQHRFLGPSERFDAAGFSILALTGPVIGPPDRERGLLVPDATWRHLPYLEARISGGQPRSLPAELRTAYPRRSKRFEDPSRGLASVEALFAALCLMGLRDETLLAHYHWAREFLELNADLLGR